MVLHFFVVENVVYFRQSEQGYTKENCFPLESFKSFPEFDYEFKFSKSTDISVVINKAGKIHLKDRFYTPHFSYDLDRQVEQYLLTTEKEIWCLLLHQGITQDDERVRVQMGGHIKGSLEVVNEDGVLKIQAQNGFSAEKLLSEIQNWQSENSSNHDTSLVT